MESEMELFPRMNKECISDSCILRRFLSLVTGMLGMYIYSSSTGRTQTIRLCQMIPMFKYVTFI